MKKKKIVLPIESTFTVGKVKIGVVRDSVNTMNCVLCVFDHAPYHMLCGFVACCKGDRSDKESVHFEVVK